MKHLAAFCLLCASGLSGCVAPPPPVEAPVVPPPYTERVPTPPRSQVPLVWRPGYHDWTGDGYVWMPGRWQERGAHSALWQDGYWERRGADFVWVPPRWL